MATREEEARRYQRSVSNPFANIGPIIDWSRYNKPQVQAPQPQPQPDAAASLPALLATIKSFMQPQQPQQPQQVPAEQQLPAQIASVARNLPILNQPTDPNPVRSAITSGIRNTPLPFGGNVGALDGLAHVFNNDVAPVVSGTKPAVPAAPTVSAPKPTSPWYGDTSNIYRPSPLFQKILGLEGGMKNGKFLTSPAGAIGPAQVMPGTAPEAARLAGLPYDEKKYRTDATYNMQIGEAYFNKQLETFGDPVKAAAAYNAGPGNVNKALTAAQQRGGDWTSYLPQETQNYVRNFVNGSSSSGPMFQNPFDPSAYNGVNAALDQAEQAALTPQTIGLPDVPAPPMPDAPVMPKRDWSDTDADLEAMRPVLDIEKDRGRIERANLFEGLARGMAAISGDAGLGETLLKIGAGMLSGRASADAEIQKRVDQYDEKMAQFKMLQFKYDDAKAGSKYNEAVDEVKGLYEHNMKKWGVQYDQWQKDFTVQQGPGGTLLVGSRTDAGRQMQVIPLEGVIKSQFGLQRAQIAGQIANAQQAGNATTAGLNNQIILGEYLQEQANGGATVTPEARMKQWGTNIGLVAGELITSGMAPMLIGQDAYAKQSDLVKKQMATEGVLQGTDGYDERFQTIMATRLAVDLANDPAFAKGVQTALPQLYQSAMARRLREEKTTTTTDARGRTSTRTQY